MKSPPRKPQATRRTERQLDLFFDAEPMPEPKKIIIEFGAAGPVTKRKAANSNKRLSAEAWLDRRPYLKFALQQAHLPDAPKKILLCLGKAANSQGICSFNVKTLVAKTGVRSTRLRGFIDLLISESLILLKSTLDHKNGVQTGFMFRMVRNDTERNQALSEGFFPRRQSCFGNRPKNRRGATKVQNLADHKA